MADYLVTWTIDIDDVGDERQAAEAALAIMRDTWSEALVFSVKEHSPHSRRVNVDLGVRETAADQLRRSTRGRRR